jgi:ferrochelatase
MSKKVVILFNLGGVESLDKVKDFLLNLFGDPDVIKLPFGKVGQFLLARLIVKLRLKSVTEKYRQMGGRSPILDITEKQALALEKSLGDGFEVKVINRCSVPRAKDVIPGLENYDQVILLPLFPQYSTTTTNSCVKEFYSLYKGSLEKVKLIEFWYFDEAYNKVWVDFVKAELLKFSNPDQVHILFSAHSLPKKVIRQGDPYQKQLEAQFEMLKKMLSLPNPIQLCYQSKVGPTPWLEPSTPVVLKEISMIPQSEVLVIPISFVSDHFETNYEIDIEFKELAHELGIKTFKRVPSLNTHPDFIAALKDLVKKNLN